MAVKNKSAFHIVYAFDLFGAASLLFMAELKRSSANMDLGICRIWRDSVWSNGH